MREADLRRLISSVRLALNPELFRLRKLYGLRGWDMNNNPTIKLTEEILTQLNKANQTLDLGELDVMKLILLLWESLRNIYMQLFSLGTTRNPDLINIRIVSHNLGMAHGISDLIGIIIDLKKHNLDEKINGTSLRIMMQDTPHYLHTTKMALSGSKKIIPAYGGDIMRDIKQIRDGITYSGFTSLKALSIF